MDTNKSNSVNRTIWSYWGPGDETNMTPIRKQNFIKTKEGAGVPVILITSSNINDYVYKDYPMHSAFKYLTEVHKSDYIRVYTWKFYGGAYADIKQFGFDWNTYFDIIDNDSTIWHLGAQEEHDFDVAGPPEVQKHYKDLNSTSHWIGRANTPLVNEIFEKQHKILDNYYEKLKSTYQTRPARCCQGTDQQKYNYPIYWNELLGQIYHPICLKYREYLKHGLPWFVRNVDYGAEESINVEVTDPVFQ